MSNCKGLHCDGCHHGGGPAAAVIALLVIVAVAARSAWPHVVHAVEIAAWTLAGVCGVAIFTTGGVLTARAVRRRRARHAVVFRYAPPVLVVVDETQFARPLPSAGQHVRRRIEPPGH